LTCSVDATASSDPDGTIAGYTWNFGDGATATGRVASHDYAVAGNYTVTLTVTDNTSATDSTTRGVNPARPPDATVLATDAFTRAVTNGLGTALSGGPWTTTGSVSMYSVDGTGRIRLATPGTTANAFLGQVSSTASDLLFTVSVDKMPTGTGIYVSASGRNVVGVGAYRTKIVLRSTGLVGLSLSRRNHAAVGDQRAGTQLRRRRSAQSAAAGHGNEPDHDPSQGVEAGQHRTHNLAAHDNGCHGSTPNRRRRRCHHLPVEFGDERSGDRHDR
jgi:hypothetical protein